MKNAKLIFFNIVFWVLTYYALIENVEGAFNVVVFWISTLAFISMMSLHKDVRSLYAKECRSSHRKWFVMIDTVLLAAYVWFGHWVFGIIFLTYLVCQEMLWTVIAKDKAEAKAHETVD